MTVAAGDRLESIFAGEVTPEFFQLFGARTQVGRTFTEAEGFANGDATLRYIVEGRPLDGLYHRMGGWRPISSRSFETLKIPLVSGRTFSDRDALTAPGVVIINQAMADKWWPSGGAIGQRTVLGKGIGGVWNELHREIVGIVANVRDSSLDREPQPANYVPITQLRMPLQLGWLVRTQVDPESLRPRI
jgi:putative ABC transport system permease protein